MAKNAKLSILHYMSNIVIIKRENTKGREAMKKLHEAKAALRAFIARGGSVKDYVIKKK